MISKCNTINKSKQGWTSMEPVDLFDVLVQVPTSAFLYWSVPSSFDHEIMNLPEFPNFRTMITSSILLLRTQIARTTSRKSFSSMDLGEITVNMIMMITNC